MLKSVISATVALLRQFYTLQVHGRTAAVPSWPSTNFDDRPKASLSPEGVRRGGFYRQARCADVAERRGKLVVDELRSLLATAVAMSRASRSQSRDLLVNNTTHAVVVRSPTVHSLDTAGLGKYAFRYRTSCIDLSTWLRTDARSLALNMRASQLT